MSFESLGTSRAGAFYILKGSHFPIKKETARPERSPVERCYLGIGTSSLSSFCRS